MKEINITIKVNGFMCHNECTWLGFDTYCGFPIPKCLLFNHDLCKGHGVNEVVRSSHCQDVGIAIK